MNIRDRTLHCNARYAADGARHNDCERHPSCRFCARTGDDLVAVDGAPIAWFCFLLAS
jgi:hypothetical protein